jgi:hypothetical protein
MQEDFNIDEVLHHPKLSDEFKLKFFEELFNCKLTENNIEYEFKKWRANNIESSNVKKIMYEDETMEMVIQFNDKSIYTYFNVPFDTFLNVSGGNATCITDGENRWGSWYVGKTPSVGASVHKYLINEGVKYKKGGSFR